MLVNIKKIIGKILNTPLVIEESTSGIWTCRKWTDGRAECWGTWTGTLSHYTTGLGGYAYNTGIINYPTNFFVEEPNAYFSGRIGSGFCNTGTVYAASKDGINCYAISTSSGSQSCIFFIYAVGKWMTLDPDSQTMIAPTFSQEQMSKASIRALIEGSGHIYRENSNWTPSDLL